MKSKLIILTFIVLLTVGSWIILYGGLTGKNLPMKPPTEENLPETPTEEPRKRPAAPEFHPVNFIVHVPKNTPKEDNIYLLFLSFYDGSETRRIPMIPRNDGTYFTKVENLPVRALLRYTYDRGREGWDQRGKRENFNDKIKVEFRYLLVSPSTTTVEDTVARWRDLPSFPPTGAISGVVRDNVTKEPIMDATISISGVHLGTGFDGSFTLENVPVGKHRVTVTTTLGDYIPSSKTIEVKEGETTAVDFDLDRAQKVKVTFKAIVPERTPENAVVKIAGNIYQLGSVCWLVNQLTPDPARWVRMNKVSENSFAVTL